MNGARRTLPLPVRALLSCVLGAAVSIEAAPSLTEFLIPRPNTRPTDITAGPDGALWFTGSDFSNGRRIGRMATSGDVVEFSIPGPNPLPNSILAGPDGALWFADYGNGDIARKDVSGAITRAGRTGRFGFATLERERSVESRRRASSTSFRFAPAKIPSR